MQIKELVDREALAEVKIFSVLNPSDDYSAWDIQPIDADIVSLDDDGVSAIFIVEASLILDSGEIELCFTDIAVPERISEGVFLYSNNEIVRRDRWDVNGDVIPKVSIEYPGDYGLFYSRKRPNSGIEVLEHGLLIAKKKFAVAMDLGYILRDEGHNVAAIKAFSIAIDEDPTNYFPFVERAQLFEKIGNRTQAKEDWSAVERLAGEQVVRMYS